ncbi:hypothetical protein V6N13_079143 [Hibiscus sabdariffa]
MEKSRPWRHRGATASPFSCIPWWVKSQINPLPPTSATSNGNNNNSGENNQSLSRVQGCIISVQKSHTVEIFNNFKPLHDSSIHSIDRFFLEKKQELNTISISFINSFIDTYIFML